MGEYFANANTKFTAIHASTLKRAFSTAQALYDAQPEPKPVFTKSLLLREQYFGIAEGRPWTFTGEEYVYYYFIESERLERVCLCVGTLLSNSSSLAVYSPS